jgi:hypothetical protein
MKCLLFLLSFVVSSFAFAVAVDATPGASAVICEFEANTSIAGATRPVLEKLNKRVSLDFIRVIDANLIFRKPFSVSAPTIAYDRWLVICVTITQN